MAPPHEVPTESTGLLGENPSPSSTDSPVLTKYKDESLPLTSSYEDLRGSVELQLKAMKKQPKKKMTDVSIDKNVLEKKHAIFILIFGCALCVMLLSLVAIHPPPPGERPHNPGQPKPFSRLDPVKDLKLMKFDRPVETAPPANLFEVEEVSNDHLSARRSTFPTNSWYQNMLMVRGEPSNLQRAYSIPYMVDVVGQIPGLRINSNRILSGQSVLQLNFNELFGLTLGAIGDVSGPLKAFSRNYTVMETTELGFTLKWNAYKMTSSIVYGMPYATMLYEERRKELDDGSVMFPTISSRIAFSDAPVIDGSSSLKCSASGSEVSLVDHEIKLHFKDSDYSWLLFFSEPVSVKCVVKEDGRTFLQIVESAEGCESPLVVRAAILDTCTTGKNSVSCKLGLGERQPEESQTEAYAALLRRHANIYPGRHGSVEYMIKESEEKADLIFNWDPRELPSECRRTTQQILRKSSQAESDANEIQLITYALPHHFDRFGSSVLPGGLLYCKASMSGRTCVVEGSIWSISEDLPRVGLRAPRPPRPEFIPQIANTLQDDIEFSLPDFFMKGAGDTYFSGKMLAKLGRILLVAEEVNEICEERNPTISMSEYEEYCNNSTLLTDDQISDAIDRLRTGVEIWLNGNAEAPFVYDAAWGGVVSCGCQFNGDGCDNEAPNCPAFYDQGLNFGNAFYNDQHFHYGYHIYAAAILAHFDEKWGKEFFEQVLLLVRNIANPSKEDESFPLFRHKDWFRGFSWASGAVNPPYLNGKNQESSSEAIAAYEAVAVYGQVMSSIWESARDGEKAEISHEIMRVGQLMTATELRSAQKYWHVLQKEPNERVYPEIYTSNVVGIIWTTMIQFGTWFGAAPYLPYGIQLLPLTPISEERDDLRWANEMYYPFSQACSESFQCTESGWVILQLAILATVGYSKEAAQRTKILPDDSFTNAGGNGHSRSNTLWYVATRPVVENPVPMASSDFRGENEKRPAPAFALTNCHTPSTCTDEVLDRKAGEFTCRERINWEINSMGKSQWEACSAVAGSEYPDICGSCDPGNHDDKNDSNEEASLPDSSACPACTLDQCNSDLNRCPVYDRTFVCTGGANLGGCAGEPWANDESQCTSCCEMTKCQQLRDNESKKVNNDGSVLGPPKCPPCPAETCYGKMNQCPLHTAPFLCMSGSSVGGCSPVPWALQDGQCTECCEITVDC